MDKSQAIIAKVVLLASCLFTLPLAAADPTLKFIGITPGQAYEFVYQADGTATLRPILIVAVGGVPTPSPTPTPTPTPVPNPTLAAQAQTLTRAAITEGGSVTTASSLAAVYSVVASQVNADKLPLASIGPALRDLSDVVVPVGEKAVWDKWRVGTATLMAGNLNTKSEAVNTLTAISDGTKAAVDGLAKETGAPAIDWGAIIALLLPLLLKLLEKWLNPLAM